MTAGHFDAVVIGGGSAGYAAARTLTSGGAKTAVPQKDMVNPANDKLLKELYGDHSKDKGAGCPCTMKEAVAGA